jgi:hypothetical protein
MLILGGLFLLLHSENLRMPQPLHIFEDSAAKSGIFAYFIASLSDAAASSFLFCENADFSAGESEMASLSSPESRIKAAAQPGIKNQARCARAGIKNQESAGGGNNSHTAQAHAHISEKAAWTLRPWIGCWKH